MKIAQPIINEITPESSALLIFRGALEQKRVNVDLPLKMVDQLDQEANRLGVTRQSIIKVWLAERLDRPKSIGVQ